MRFISLMAAICAISSPRANSQEGKKDDTILLFNGKDFTGWTHYLSTKGNEDGKLKMEDVWSVDAERKVICCKGKPNGYIRTTTDYMDYVLKLEWRYPAEAGNSGVLLRMVGEDKVWPKCIEAQLLSGRAGDFWVLGGDTLETPKERINPNSPNNRMHAKPNEKPLGEWNEYEITVHKDKITLKVNGEVLNEGTGADEVGGKICLQSEGVPIEFRNVRLTPIK